MSRGYPSRTPVSGRSAKVTQALRSGPRPMDGCGRHDRARRWRCASGRGSAVATGGRPTRPVRVRKWWCSLLARRSYLAGHRPFPPGQRDHGSVPTFSRWSTRRWEPSSGRTLVFTSRDGLHWSRGADLGTRVDPGSITVTTWRHELWAVSYPSRGANASLIWRSPDGSSWSHPDVPFSPPGTVFDQLIPIGPYLVATGFDTNSRPGGWVTTDGSHWIPMPDLRRPPGGRLDIATSNSDALVRDEQLRT